jgi:pimeloyl-ACP methyl ester carboxylesterase
MQDQNLHVRRWREAGRAGRFVFLHATGLNGSAYGPLLEELSFDGEVLTPSLRGHGASRLPANPKRLKNWKIFASDIETEIRNREEVRPLILAGHSAGAVTAMLAAKDLRPERLLMIEPVCLPDHIYPLARTPLWPFISRNLGIANAAAARRPAFPSREAAEANYRDKPFFARWADGALEGYLDEGLRKTEEGVGLSCEPAFEAACFRAQGHGFWPHLKTVLGLGIPVSILASTRGSTFKAKFHERARRLGAEVTQVKGGHMIPLEDPAFVGDWIEARLN